MTPFEDLYGRRYRTPLCWYEAREHVVLSPQVVQETTEKIKMIKEKMIVSQEGYYLFQRVTQVTDVGRPLKFQKLTPCFIGPY